ncbi:MAG: radical SAM protein [Deltaproteobacteria bacterium]|jgi:7-carboxy-7-deazaguanine synthase|nr:radical SAM protein [Deltaproteobacteria bacterium]
MIKINEIFYSIQGETTYSGLPTVFVRTTGCHLRCTYCDTQYSYYEGRFKDSSEILSEIKKYSTNYVCITGGEPLLQKSVLILMSLLCDLNYKVSLETSGSKVIDQVDPRVKIILDVKTPDSGAKNSFLLENLNFANTLTELKFVICSENDFNWSENFCRQHDLFEKYTVLYSPSYGNVSERWLAEKILNENSSARLQLQLHKIIWDPNKRGV